MLLLCVFSWKGYFHKKEGPNKIIFSGGLVPEAISPNFI